MEHLFAAALAVFAGSIVEGILGFGCSLVWMSFFPLFTSVPDAVGVLQPMHIALNMILLASIWKNSTPHELKPLAMTVPFGIVFGLWIVTSWSSNAIDFVLGAFLIVYTFLKNDGEGHGHHHSEEADHVPVQSDLVRKSSDLELDPLDEIRFGEEKKDDYSPSSLPSVEEIPHQMLETSPLTHRHPIYAAEAGASPIPDLSNVETTKKRIKGRKKNSSRKSSSLSSNPMLRNPTAICAGLVGGALMGAFGTGGPAFLIYAKEAGWQKRPELFRANLQLLFFIINAVCCFSQFEEGIITYERCKASLWLSPALLAGGQVGRILATKVPKEKFQVLVVNGLRIMGFMFLIEATR